MTRMKRNRRQCSQPSGLQVIEVTGLVRLFSSFEEGKDDALCDLCTFEDKVMTVSLKEKKQKAIKGYFNQ